MTSKLVESFIDRLPESRAKTELIEAVQDPEIGKRVAEILEAEMDTRKITQIDTLPHSKLDPEVILQNLINNLDQKYLNTQKDPEDFPFLGRDGKYYPTHVSLDTADTVFKKTVKT